MRIPRRSLSDDLAAIHNDIMLSEAEVRSNNELSHNLYRAAAELNLARSAGSAYAAAMHADVVIKRVLHDTAERINAHRSYDQVDSYQPTVACFAPSASIQNLE